MIRRKRINNDVHVLLNDEDMKTVRTQAAANDLTVSAQVRHVVKRWLASLAGSEATAP